MKITRMIYSEEKKSKSKPVDEIRSLQPKVLFTYKINVYNIINYANPFDKSIFSYVMNEFRSLRDCRFILKIKYNLYQISMT